MTPVSSTSQDRRWRSRAGDLEVMLAQAAHERGRGPWRAGLTRLVRDRVACAALVFLAVLGLSSLLVPLLPIPSPAELDLQIEPQAPIGPWREFVDHRFRPGSIELSGIDRWLDEGRRMLFGDRQSAHWLGTDAKGRDILARILWGSRTSLAVALMAASCSLVIGVTYGAVAGLAGGRIDHWMMRVVDILYSVPFIFVVIFVITIVNEYRSELEDRFGIDRGTIFFVVIGAISWLTMARVVRGQVLALRKSEFIDAARVLGASNARILFVHVLPNVLSIVIVYLTLTIPSVMLFEAFLSFLGLGIEPPKVSWGILAVESTEAINPVRLYWWMIVFPALAMGSTLFALNVLGDGLRDALDPRLKGRT